MADILVDGRCRFRGIIQAGREVANMEWQTNSAYMAKFCFGLGMVGPLDTICEGELTLR
jgi:hypothetical protein